MKKIEKQCNIINNPPYSSSSLSIERTLDLIIDAVNLLISAHNEKESGEGRCCGRCRDSHDSNGMPFCNKPDCKCHKPQPTAEEVDKKIDELVSSQDWEMEYKDKFAPKLDALCNQPNSWLTKDIKSFISSLLTSQKAADREKIVAGLRGKKILTTLLSRSDIEDNQVEGYNTGLFEAITFIEGLEK